MSAVHGFMTTLTNKVLHNRGEKRKKKLINDDNLLDNITARRDSEELFCVIQQNRITNKS